VGWIWGEGKHDLYGAMYFELHSWGQRKNEPLPERVGGCFRVFQRVTQWLVGAFSHPAVGPHRKRNSSGPKSQTKLQSFSIFTHSTGLNRVRSTTQQPKQHLEALHTATPRNTPHCNARPCHCNTQDSDTETHCNILQHIRSTCERKTYTAISTHTALVFVLHHVAACCSVLQRVAVHGRKGRARVWWNVHTVLWHTQTHTQRWETLLVTVFNVV